MPSARRYMDRENTMLLFIDFPLTKKDQVVVKIIAKVFDLSEPACQPLSHAFRIMTMEERRLEYRAEQRNHEYR